jgi:hypothetical protein
VIWNPILNKLVRSLSVVEKIMNTKLKYAVLISIFISMFIADSHVTAATSAARLAVPTDTEVLKAGADPDFDAGYPPSPRSLSQAADDSVKKLFEIH